MQTTTTEEKKWLQLLLKDDEKALQLIFDRYYKYLVVTAYNLLGDDHRSKDLVQDVFFELWKKRENLNVHGSLKSYLRKAVINRCIDEIRRKKRSGTPEDIRNFEQPDQNTSPQQQLETQELQQVINRAIDSLPHRCREVFALSRLEGWSHKEIAEKLGISVKTIENQMTKALKIIRAVVNKYGLWIGELLAICFWLFTNR